MRTTNRVKAFAVAALVLALAVVAAFLAHGAEVTAPLFAQSREVPSVVNPAPPPQLAAAVERTRELVRAAMLEQNLPGVSVAVGIGSPPGAVAKAGLPLVVLAEGGLVWAEGFGWRDVDTRTPVTPDTRFNIGTAASEVTGAVTSLGLTRTGADEAKIWSPEAIGEEGEDFPPLALLRHRIWQPLGLMDREYPLPGNRATFYVPRSDNDPRSGRRLMYMRDLACCANGMAFSSTPSDLVRFALATNAGSIGGELAGGTVMSLVTDRGSGVVVAVTSNMAHANTSALAQRVANALAK